MAHCATRQVNDSGTLLYVLFRFSAPHVVSIYRNFVACDQGPGVSSRKTENKVNDAKIAK